MLFIVFDVSVTANGILFDGFCYDRDIFWKSITRSNGCSWRWTMVIDWRWSSRRKKYLSKNREKVKELQNLSEIPEIRMINTK